MIGVSPGKQGNGIGSALLGLALERCDADGRLAYLEGSTTRSARLYERHGFQPAGLIQVGSSPPLLPMLRKPRRLTSVSHSWEAEAS
jgi:GNAT superfamily N-acetyltransferase